MNLLLFWGSVQCCCCCGGGGRNYCQPAWWCSDKTKACPRGRVRGSENTHEEHRLDSRLLSNGRICIQSAVCWGATGRGAVLSPRAARTGCTRELRDGYRRTEHVRHPRNMFAFPKRRRRMLCSVCAAAATYCQVGSRVRWPPWTACSGCRKKGSATWLRAF